MAPPDLSLDVAINRARRVTAIFAGPLPDRTRRGVCSRAVVGGPRGRHPFDLVVSTNGGYPLDRNLYQAVKGMAAAERIVRDAGIVVMAAACEDGVPAGDAFARLVGGAATPAQLAGASGGPELDRWQAQVLGRVLSRVEVHFHGAGLDPAEIEDAFLVPAPDLDGAVAAALGRLGPQARVAVIPEGPLTVATVRPPE